MATCKACGAEIIWKKTRSGKNMPLDDDPRRMGMISKDGMTVWIGDCYPIHWETCPNADDFRRKGGKEGGR